MNQAAFLSQVFFLLLLFVGVQSQGEIHSSEAFKGFGQVQNQNSPNEQPQPQLVPEPGGAAVPETTTDEDIIDTGEVEDFSPEQLARNQEYIREWARRAQADLKQRQLQKPHKVEDWKEHEGFFRNTVALSKEQWAIFEEAIGIQTPGESPVEALVIAAKYLVAITTQMRLLVDIMKKKKPRGLQKLDENFVNLSENALESLEYVYDARKLEVEGRIKKFWSWIGKDKAIDPDLAINTVNLDNMMARIVRGAMWNDTIIASGSHIGAMWDCTVIAQREIWSSFTKIQDLLQTQLNNFPGAKKEYLKAKGPRGSPLGQGRQDVGYAQYLKNRYLESSYFNIQPFMGLSKDGKIEGPPWKNWEGSTHMTGELYLAYFSLLDKLFFGVLPLILEMIMDIMLAADVFIGRISITPDVHFPYSMSPRWNEWNWLSWLEQYPEFDIEEWYRTKTLEPFSPPPSAFPKPPRSGGRSWADWSYWTEWREDNPLMET
ncbi:hypothetical protein TWF694_003636 [Orbilia ellipsospora]|uniref:Uncharacterized protein n=1 Tax=Orbilia ellipsospora TaxID=2528407 RepID=A0AAV9WYT5_9PEZI